VPAFVAGTAASGDDAARLLDRLLDRLLGLTDRRPVPA
jgi:hypothetical protein